MIKSVTIKNFETWINTRFELDTGVNVFTGESDKGKSGIIRALKWNTFNRPQGDSYRNDIITDPKDSVLVSVTYEEGDKIDRERDGKASGVNNYRINGNSPLVALRTDVPTEISDISRMKDVNIQGQHPTEQYFLLADKPGAVAKAFNKVAGLTIMDNALSDINSQVREANAELKVYKKEIEAREEQLSDLDWVEKAEKFALKLKSFKSKLDEKVDEKENLENFIRSIQEVNLKLTSFTFVPTALKEAKELETEKTVLFNVSNRIKKLSELIAAVKLSDLKISTTLDTQKVLNKLKTLEKIRAEQETRELRIYGLALTLKKLTKNQEEFRCVSEQIEEITKEYDLIRETTECPVCGRKGK